MAASDRIIALRKQAHRFTGIDFVQVVEPCEQTKLRVFFHTEPALLVPPFFALPQQADQPPPPSPVPLAREHVRIVSTVAGVPDVPLDPLEELVWGVDAVTERRYLELTVEAPGDFVPYCLFIDDPYAQPSPPVASRVDRVFNGVEFSFKAGCPGGLDCADVAEPCCEPPEEHVTIDYLARDFVSLRNAMLDFLSQRYPDWTLPIEADVGVMFIEVLAALGDELSYMQDRVAREAFLETLSQRRSLRRLARLVDYALHDGRTAATHLELRLAADVTVHAGARAFAVSDYEAAVPYEVVADDFGTIAYAFKRAHDASELAPYAWDEGELCLAAGARHLDLAGAIEGADSWVERPLLLKLDPTDGAAQPRRMLVHVSRVEPLRDELFARDVTRVHFAEGETLPCAWPLAGLSVTPNLVPVRAGETRVAYLRCGDARPGDPPFLHTAVEREGALYAAAGEREPFDLGPCVTCKGSSGERPTVFLFSLPGSEAQGLGFTGDELRDARPELAVWRIDSLPEQEGTLPSSIGRFESWEYRPTLLSEPPGQPRFTLEDGTFRRIVAYHRNGDEFVHRDYASGRGYTLRFGDDTFGRSPARDDLFYLEYRLGTGARGNVPAGTIRELEARGYDRNMPSEVIGVENPFVVCNGADPESAEDAKMFAPEAFKDKRFFALREQDYGDQLVDNLPWVQRAQGSFRWTGSWHTALATVDPVNSVAISTGQRDEAERLLDCVRQAGRDVSLRAPRYMDLDVQILVCLEPWAYAGEVRPRLMERLLGKGKKPGFFHPDSFTFGTPLRRSALEALIQEVEGVHAVHGVRVRARGQRAFRTLRELSFSVPADTVIRVDHDPAHPERGSLELLFEGGA